MTWPHTIPEGLRDRLAEVLSFRSHGPAEVWGAVRDWLVENGVEMPDHIKPEPPPGETAQQDQ